MLQGKVIDADGHILEPPDLWTRYLENKYKDRPAYLVVTVGQNTVTAALFAHDGAADGPMGQVCRGDQSRLKADEKEDCKKVLADKSETQESLQPAVIELAKVLVANVRAGKGSK